MNQSQRKFLIDKIEKSAKDMIGVLEDSKPESPSIENYLLHAVMGGNFELHSIDELKETIRQMALESKGRDSWTGGSWGRASYTSIHLPLKDVFIIPEEYTQKERDIEKRRNEIQKEINAIRSKCDTLVVRLTLASNSVLETMIKEVDDMGDLSLMDTKLKALTS